MSWEWYSITAADILMAKGGEVVWEVRERPPYGNRRGQDTDRGVRVGYHSIDCEDLPVDARPF
jgi:hypothetical protein